MVNQVYNFWVRAINTSSVYTALHQLKRISYRQTMEWKPREQAGNDFISYAFLPEKYYVSATWTDEVDGRILDLTGW